MELNGGGQECRGDLGVQAQSAIHEVLGEFLHGAKEVGQSQVLAEDAHVDGRQSILIGEADGEHAEVAL